MARLTAERLREVISYDPETGVFCWRVTLSNRNHAGSRAGCQCSRDDYRLIGIDGVVYKANRLAWLYMTGKWPAHLIDHKNLDRGDDRWDNLREATHSQNLSNRGAQRNNTSGFKGVHFHPQSGRWRARIAKDGKHISLGLHDTAENAHLAYTAAAIDLHGEFAHA